MTAAIRGKAALRTSTRLALGLGLGLLSAAHVTAQASGPTSNPAAVIGHALSAGREAIAVEREYVRAQAAYDRLKTTEGAEFMHSWETAASRAGEEAVGYASQELLRTIALEAGSTVIQRKVIGSLFVVADMIEYFRWLRLDATLVSRNVRANWQVFARLRPAAQRYEVAQQRLTSALSTQGPDPAGVTLEGLDVGRAFGRCAPDWSGPAIVTVVVADGPQRWPARVPCQGGRWEAEVRRSQTIGAAYGYAALGDGRRDVIVSPVRKLED